MDCLRQITKHFSHFALALEMPLCILGQQFPGGIQMSVFTDTGKDVYYFTAVRFGVLDTVSRQQRQAKMVSQIDQLLILSFFTAHEVALDFNEDVCATEGVDQESEAIGGAVGN